MPDHLAPDAVSVTREGDRTGSSPTQSRRAHRLHRPAMRGPDGGAATLTSSTWRQRRRETRSARPAGLAPKCRWLPVASCSACTRLNSAAAQSRSSRRLSRSGSRVRCDRRPAGSGQLGKSATSFCVNTLARAGMPSCSGFTLLGLHWRTAAGAYATAASVAAAARASPFPVARFASRDLRARGDLHLRRQVLKCAGRAPGMNVAQTAHADLRGNGVLVEGHSNSTVSDRGEMAGGLLDHSLNLPSDPAQRLAQSCWPASAVRTTTSPPGFKMRANRQRYAERRPP